MYLFFTRGVEEDERDESLDGAPAEEVLAGECQGIDERDLDPPVGERRDSAADYRAAPEDRIVEVLPVAPDGVIVQGLEQHSELRAGVLADLIDEHRQVVALACLLGADDGEDQVAELARGMRQLHVALRAQALAAGVAAGGAAVLAPETSLGGEHPAHGRGLLPDPGPHLVALRRAAGGRAGAAKRRVLQPVGLEAVGTELLAEAGLEQADHRRVVLAFSCGEKTRREGDC
jgi:hypothetical protein